MPKKAQSAFEFLLLVGVVFFAVVILVAASYSNIAKLREERDFLITRDTAFVVQNELVLANVVEDGYSRSFLVPDELDGQQYSMMIVGNSLTVSTQKASYSVRIPSVQGTIAKGWNNLTKEGNVVVLNG
jgi:hypothetical protein